MERDSVGIYEPPLTVVSKWGISAMESYLKPVHSISKRDIYIVLDNFIFILIVCEADLYILMLYVSQ